MKNYIFIFTLTLTLIGCIGIPEIKESQIRDLKKDSLKTNSHEVFFSKKWWLYTNDNTLIQLIDEVLLKNSQIKVAKLNVEKALYTLNSTKFSNVSPIAISGNYNRARLDTSVYTDLPIKDIKNSETIDTGILSLNAEYIFDIWGKFEALKNRAEYFKDGNELQLDWTTLTLSTFVSNLYANYILLSKEEQILNKRLLIAKDFISFETTLYSTGAANRSSILESKNYLNNIIQSLNSTAQQKTIIQNTLYSLVGEIKSEKIDIALNTIEKEVFNFPFFITTPEFIDSDVIINRSDVKYYLTLISGQKENLKALTADFYPRISISGQYQYYSLNIQDLLKSETNLWNIGPSFYLPLFNRRILKENYKIAGIDLNIFIENYNNNVIRAYQDINNNLNDLKIANNNNNLQKKNYNNSKTNYEDAKLLFKIGRMSKYELLKCENDLLSAKFNYILNSFNLYQSQIKLVESLGGYYENKGDINGN